MTSKIIFGGRHFFRVYGFLQWLTTFVVTSCRNAAKTIENKWFTPLFVYRKMLPHMHLIYKILLKEQLV
jgi:hypothetical protein